jgi:hypothetical protein
MANCPKCNDPVSPGETFCGKCGAPIPVASSVPPTPATPPPVSVPAGKKKTWLWLVLAAVVVVIVLIILGVMGVFGGSAAATKYVQNTAPDFKTVTDSLNSLEKTLTYESSGDVAKDLERMEKELANIDSAKKALIAANSKVETQLVTAPVQKLDADLRDFYTTLTTDLDYRYEIINYFYTAESIGNKVEAAGGSTDYQNIVDVQEGFRQLKYALDAAVADLQDVKVPAALQKVHESDIDILKRMSTILGNMVKEIEMMDEVGLTSSFSQFESLMSEYDTKVTKKYQEILEPEFANLNQALETAAQKKDVIEDEYAHLKGKYNIKSQALDMLR